MQFIKYFFLLFFFFYTFTKNLLAADVLYLEDNFFPEGITVSKNGDLFVGSLKENKIIKFKNKKKEAEIFIPSNSNNLNSVIGILADDRNKILWACSSNPGVSNYPTDGLVSLKAFDLSSGDFLQSYEFPNGSFCNDITLDSNGGSSFIRLSTASGNLYINKDATGYCGISNDSSNLENLLFDNKFKSNDQLQNSFLYKVKADYYQNNGEND